MRKKADLCTYVIKRVKLKCLEISQCAYYLSGRARLSTDFALMTQRPNYGVSHREIIGIKMLHKENNLLTFRGEII